MTSFTAIADLALSAATDAALSHPFFAEDHADCGSAWVVVPQQKGRKAFLAALQAECPSLRISQHHSGGKAIHILSGISKQSRAIFEAGCDAFVNTLKAHGLQAHVYSFAD